MKSFEELLDKAIHRLRVSLEVAPEDRLKIQSDQVLAILEVLAEELKKCQKI